jgi:hypothetical protein
LKSKHDDSPGERAAEGPANSPEVLASRRTVLNRFQLALFGHDRGWIQAVRFIYLLPSQT